MYTGRLFARNILANDRFIKFGVVKEASRISYYEWQQIYYLVKVTSVEVQSFFHHSQV
jgi:hypothetical protein